MKRFFITQYLGITLILLLTFTIFYPLLTTSSYYESNMVKFSYRSLGLKENNPILPQPASPEYLIISPNDAWVQSFAEWKTLKGVPTRVANVTWIQTNYPLSPTVRDKPEQIWTFINDVYTSISPSTLQWVLLIGDNTTIPSRYVYLPDTTEWTGEDPNRKPTDFYYAAMDDSDWDEDSDGRWGECATFNVGGPATDEIDDWQPDLYSI
jgi:hypothetical protein